MENGKDAFIRLLEGLKPGIDFEGEEHLVGDGLLDSLDIVNIITEIFEKYGIEISGDDIDPDNFESAGRIWEIVVRRGE